MAKKSRGWRNEPARHSLASKGVKTIPMVVSYHGGHYHRMENLIGGKKSVPRGYDNTTYGVLAEIRRAGFWNNFDGEHIANKLLEYDALWEEVRLGDNAELDRAGGFDEIFIYPKKRRENDLVIIVLEEFQPDDLEWVKDQHGNKVLRAWWD